MRHTTFAWALLAIAAMIAGGLQFSRIAAEDGMPVSDASPVGTRTMVLAERVEHQTTLDLGEPGTSAGDVLYWEPNPLYDGANTTDTGAVSMGTCVVVSADFDCVLVETITFPDGSTLQFQAGQPTDTSPYLRTIVGGSAEYLGAIGSATAVERDDGRVWTRTIEVQIP